MLGKLIKYDLKALARVFLLVHVLFLIACIFARFFFVNRLDFHAPSTMLVTPVMILVSVFFILIIAITFFTWLMMAFRFYRNLFSREGYLSWTLPVSGAQHLWSKIISGYLFMSADIIIIAVGVLILCTGKNVTDAYSIVAPAFNKEFGMTVSEFGALLFLFSMIASISSVIMTYCCIAIGQLFPGHRILCAIASYFIISLVIQLVSTLIMLAQGYFPGPGASPILDQPVSVYMFSSFTLSGSIMLFITIAQYLITYYIIKKKVNLL